MKLSVINRGNLSKISGWAGGNLRNVSVIVKHAYMALQTYTMTPISVYIGIDSK